MTSEEDTYNRLRRIPYADLVERIQRYIKSDAYGSLENLDAGINEVIVENGWTWDDIITNNGTIENDSVSSIGHSDTGGDTPRTYAVIRK